MRDMWWALRFAPGWWAEGGFNGFLLFAARAEDGGLAPYAAGCVKGGKVAGAWGGLDTRSGSLASIELVLEIN